MQFDEVNQTDSRPGSCLADRTLQRQTFELMLEQSSNNLDIATEAEEVCQLDPSSASKSSTVAHAD